MTGVPRFWVDGVELHAAWTLQLPLATPSLNEIRGLHFRAYRRLRQQWCADVFAALGHRKPAQPLRRAFIEVWRHSRGDLDWDNAYGGLKVLIDCLVMPSSRNPSGLGLMLDDSRRVLPYPPFVHQEPALEGASATRCVVYELN